MRYRALGILALLTLAAPAVGASRPKGPKLNLRATPRFALHPTNVQVIAELIGGDEHEDYYCPALEWDWDDGSRSSHEPDCPPFEPGTSLERRFTASHGYGSPGSYNVRITLRRVDRPLAVATATVTVY